MISDVIFLYLNSVIVSFDNSHKYSSDFQLYTDSFNYFRGYLLEESNGKITALSIILDSNDI